MGKENWRVMLFVSPPVQLTAVAETMVTGEGPVITKSDPLEATELHCRGAVKFKVMDWGMQGGGITVPMGIAGCAANVKLATPPALTCAPQSPVNVLPSLPLAIVIV